MNCSFCYAVYCTNRPSKKCVLQFFQVPEVKLVQVHHVDQLDAADLSHVVAATVDDEDIHPTKPTDTDVQHAEIASQEMWYGVFLWAAVSSLVFHLPAALLSLATLRQHKMARFMPIAILLMGIVGPVCGGVLTSAAIAGVYKAAGKRMISLEALVFGVGQSFCILIISFLRVLATL
ncbi:transmembrane protein 170A isoform X1 [Siniperca chuatsi]|uniref:transmembrane protein 170A isoform X1 n=1 Tax=Siniperca chuatsi TaxID=119488 RepID=UPI001CE054FE|nr:transmembrane protein 170A isoform X1 [Siniperca chuatsi]